MLGAPDVHSACNHCNGASPSPCLPFNLLPLLLLHCFLEATILCCLHPALLGSYALSPWLPPMLGNASPPLYLPHRLALFQIPPHGASFLSRLQQYDYTPTLTNCTFPRCIHINF